MFDFIHHKILTEEFTSDDVRTFIGKIEKDIEKKNFIFDKDLLAKELLC